MDECIKCRKVIKHAHRSMILKCGAYIHLKCFKNLVRRRYRRICHLRPKRMRVRGRFGARAYWMLPRCPACREFVNAREVQLLEKLLRVNVGESDGEMEEESLSRFSIEEYAEHLRNIFMSDSSEEEE